MWIGQAWDTCLPLDLGQGKGISLHPNGDWQWRWDNFPKEKKKKNECYSQEVKWYLGKPNKQCRVSPPKPPRNVSAVLYLRLCQLGEKGFPVVRDVGKIPGGFRRPSRRCHSCCQTFLGQLFGKDKLSGCVKLEIIHFVISTEAFSLGSNRLQLFRGIQIGRFTLRGDCQKLTSQETWFCFVLNLAKRGREKPAFL